MKLTSLAFETNALIPAKYTCDGQDVNPPLRLTDVPEEAETLTLIVDDPDAPAGTWDHWVLYNIPASTTEIAEGSAPGTQGTNDFKKQSYGGPCPPGGTHRYFFELYALDTSLDLEAGARKKEVEAAMDGHLLAKAELVGRYTRQQER